MQPKPSRRDLSGRGNPCWSGCVRIDDGGRRRRLSRKLAPISVLPEFCNAPGIQIRRGGNGRGCGQGRVPSHRAVGRRAAWLRGPSRVVAGVRQRIADLGLSVESAIAFPQWLVDDSGKRALGMEQAKRDMDAVARIGGKRIAAPPAGANNGPEIACRKSPNRYRALLELGDQMGVIPELEFWGTSANLRQLAQAVFVAIEAGHPKACVLADVVSPLQRAIRLPRSAIGQQSGGVQVVHLNDYPAFPTPGDDYRP